MYPIVSPYVFENYTMFVNGGGCCMVTNWDNSTGTPTIWDLGITCAACHETPGTINPSPDVCASCHIPGGRQALGLSQSAHAKSLDDLLATGHADDSCLHCMAGQGTYIDITGTNVNDPSLTSITCVTCHDPHDASINWDEPSTHMSPYGHQLRTVTSLELCGKCHVETYELLTDTITQSSHKTFDCTDCHGYRWVPGHNDTNQFGDPIWVIGQFSFINHSWTQNPPNSCGLCHGTDNATVWTTMEEHRVNITDLIIEYDIKLNNVTTKADEASATIGVDPAKVEDIYDLIDESKLLANFAYDTTGFHNPEFIKNRFVLALGKLETAYDLVIDVIATDETTTTIPITETFTTIVTNLVDISEIPDVGITSSIGIMTAISILCVVVFFYKKRR